MPSSLANVGNIQDYNKPQTIVPMTKDYVTQTPMERAQTEAVQTSTQEKQIDMARKQKYIETYNNLPDDMPVTEKFNALSKVDPDQANIYLQWAGKNELDQATAKHANLKAQNEMIAGILDNLRTKYPTPESRKSPEFRAAYTTAYNFAKNTELGPLNMTPPDAGLESSPEIKGLYAKVLNGELTPDEGKKRIEYEVKRRSMYATMPATENFDEQTDAFKSAAISAEKQIEQKLAEANASGNMPPTTVGAGNRVLPTEVKRHNIAMEDILRQNAENKGQMSEKDDEKMGMQIAKAINPLSASSRSTLGIAGNVNMRADRALMLLKNESPTVEDKAMIVRDLQYLMQGGAPFAEEVKKGMYGSLWEDANKLIQYVTATPTALDNPDILNKLKQTILDLKEVDNKVINDNLGVWGAATMDWAARNPEEWSRMTGAVTTTTEATTAGSSEGTKTTKTTTVPPKTQGFRDKYKY